MAQAMINLVLVIFFQEQSSTRFVWATNKCSIKLITDTGKFEYV